MDSLDASFLANAGPLAAVAGLWGAEPRGLNLGDGANWKVEPVFPRPIRRPFVPTVPPREEKEEEEEASAGDTPAVPAAQHDAEATAAAEAAAVAAAPSPLFSTPPHLASSYGGERTAEPVAVQMAPPSELPPRVVEQRLEHEILHELPEQLRLLMNLARCSPAAAEEALRACGGDVDEAALALLSQQELEHEALHELPLEAVQHLGDPMTRPALHRNEAEEDMQIVGHLGSEGRIAPHQQPLAEGPRDLGRRLTTRDEKQVWELRQQHMGHISMFSEEPAPMPEPEVPRQVMRQVEVIPDDPAWVLGAPNMARDLKKAPAYWVDPLAGASYDGALDSKGPTPREEKAARDAAAAAEEAAIERRRNPAGPAGGGVRVRVEEKWDESTVHMVGDGGGPGAQLSDHQRNLMMQQQMQQQQMQQEQMQQEQHAPSHQQEQEQMQQMQQQQMMQRMQHQQQQQQQQPQHELQQEQMQRMQMRQQMQHESQHAPSQQEQMQMMQQMQQMQQEGQHALSQQEQMQMMQHMQQMQQMQRMQQEGQQPQARQMQEEDIWQNQRMTTLAADPARCGRGRGSGQAAAQRAMQADPRLPSPCQSNFAHSQSAAIATMPAPALAQRMEHIIASIERNGPTEEALEMLREVEAKYNAALNSNPGRT